MRDPVPDFDLLSVGAGLSLIAGGLSIVIPFLAGLVLSIASIVFAAWLVGAFAPAAPPSGGSRIRPSRGWLWGAIALFAAGLVFYFGAPPPMATVRGLAIAVPSVALWWISNSHVSPPENR